MKWLAVMIPSCFLLLALLYSGNGMCESLKEIENDINRLDKDVEKVKESLKSLATTITSPEASRLIFYLDTPQGSSLPRSLKIYLNDKLEHDATLDGVKKEKNLFIPLDSYFLPGNYIIRVVASFDGKIIEGKSSSAIPLKAGETGKILITKIEGKRKGILSVKSIK